MLFLFLYFNFDFSIFSTLFSVATIFVILYFDFDTAYHNLFTTIEIFENNGVHV